MFENYLDTIKQRSQNPITNAGSERAELVGKFLDRLNQDRKGNYRKLRASYVASLLSYIKSNDDLRILYKKCDEARSFGAMFWYHVKAK